MSALSFSQWVQGSGLATAIRTSQYAYPIIISLHLTCIAVFGGLILVTDLRLLGLAFNDVPVSTIIKQLRPWKWLGFVTIVTCGFLLAISKLTAYYSNPYFLTKLSLLLLVGVHAVIFRRSVYRNPELLDASRALPRVAKLAGALSLLIWVSIPIFGRMIAYYEPAETPSVTQTATSDATPTTLSNNLARQSGGDLTHR